MTPSPDHGPDHGPSVGNDHDADTATMTLPSDATAQARAIRELADRYRHVILNDGSQSAALVTGFNQLRLADALLRKAELSHTHPEHPRQLVILGPTQAGKSTLVNLLLDADTAGISARAGYTVHAQGFAVGCTASDLLPVGAALAPLQRVPMTGLDHDSLNQFVLEGVRTGSASLVSRAVVWDTPDFDSLESHGYRGAVLRAAAVADAIVLMVSKDKYADKAVWDVLDLIHRLNKPLLICINKLDGADASTVVSSFQQRHETRFGEKSPTIVALPFVAGGLQQLTDGATADPHDLLEPAIDALMDRVDRARHRRATTDYLNAHWQEWLAPVRAEQAAAEQWQHMIEDAVQLAVDTYQQRFLDDPQKYDTFNRALGELLSLLEFPGLAQSLGKTRDMVTWPMRKLLGIGKGLINREDSTPPPDQELAALESAVEQALSRLQVRTLEQLDESTGHEAWWQAMHQTFRQQRSRIETDSAEAAVDCQAEFAPRIEAAAQRLYTRLEGQPALLNTLRATRVTTDAAAVALAVKSGGLAPHDLLVAPAMLAITSLLTESVLGQYMESVKRDLKREQQQLVRERLFEQSLATALWQLTTQLDDRHLLNFNSLSGARQAVPIES